MYSYPLNKLYTLWYSSLILLDLKKGLLIIFIIEDKSSLYPSIELLFFNSYGKSISFGKEGEVENVVDDVNSSSSFYIDFKVRVL